MNIFKKLLKKIAYFCAIGFGSGLSPFMPGTAGSLVGLALAIGLQLITQNIGLMLFSALIMSLFGVYICNIASKKMGGLDHPSIVWDEIAGMFIAIIGLPFELLWYALAFLLFRLLDIIKPFPISWLDKNIKGGWGIMLDDLLAGTLTSLGLNLFFWLQ